jgi:hypothetical protein
LRKPVIERIQVARPLPESPGTRSLPVSATPHGLPRALDLLIISP